MTFQTCVTLFINEKREEKFWIVCQSMFSMHLQRMDTGASKIPKRMLKYS